MSSGHDRSESGGTRGVVLGIEHPRGVAVARSLGRRGVPVVAVERDGTARGLWSRYVRNPFLVDDDAEATLGVLESLGRAGGGVLIPTNDHFLLLVSRHHERLARFFTITVPPWDALARFMDKPTCYRMAQEAGLRTPDFFVPRDEADLDRIVSALDFTGRRYVLSVRLPVGAPADTRTARFTKVAGSDAETVRRGCLDIASRGGELPMIAEVVPGRSDRCVGVSMVVNRQHVPVLAYCVKRLQMYLYALDSGFVHPYELGANVYCESVRDDEAVAAATTFVRESRFYGAITVEFRRDARDGGLTLIKVDPRVVRATSLSTALGLDVPTALYRTFASGVQSTDLPSYREGVAWIWLTWYLDTLWQNRRRVPVTRQLWALLRNAHRVRAFAYLTLLDPMPAVVDAYRVAARGLRAFWIAARKTVRPSPSGVARPAPAGAQDTVPRA